MTEYLTEQEQIELLKNWVKQYSMVILSGVAIALVLMTGWHYYQQRRTNILNHASSVFDEMLTMRLQNKEGPVDVQANKLFTHYPRTAYGPLSALMLARDAVVKKNYPAAQTHLNWVINNSGTPAIRQIARLRLSRLLIAEQKPADSLTLLNVVDDQSFNGLIDEVRGDAYAAMKNTASARQAYKQALVELPNAETTRPILQMKYDNLST